MCTISYKSASHKNKWIKTKWLLHDQSTNSYVPQTKLYSRASLALILENYDIVFFKAVDGSGGAKIVKLTKKDNGYQKQYRQTKIPFSSIDKLHPSLRLFSGKRTFILQKGITLDKTNGKPFDIRVMVQKTI